MKRLRRVVGSLGLAGAALVMLAACAAPLAPAPVGQTPRTPASATPTVPTPDATDVPAADGSAATLTHKDARARLGTFLEDCRARAWDAAWLLLSAEQRARFGSPAGLAQSGITAGLIESIELVVDPEIIRNWLAPVRKADRARTFLFEVSYRHASDWDNSAWEMYAVGLDQDGVLGIWGDLRGY